MTISVLLFLLICLFMYKQCLCDNIDVYQLNLINKNRSNDNAELKSENPDKFHIRLNSAELKFNSAIEFIDDELCRSHVELILHGLNNLTMWSYEFYDASAKLPIGILSGSNYQFGNFDECLSIGAKNTSVVPVGIKGKYCLTELIIKVPKIYKSNVESIWSEFKAVNDNYDKRYDNSVERLYYGICVPMSCTSISVEKFMQYIVNESFNTIDIQIQPVVVDRKCHIDHSIKIDNYDIAYLATILTIVFFVLLGTLYDAITLNRKEQSQDLLIKILRAFSLISNLQKLCSHAHEDKLNLSCISGIKSTAMGFIIAGHCLVFVLGGPILNKEFWQQASGKIENAVFLNNPLLVDTFLFLSGFLFSRILLHELDKRKSINFLLLYLFRYIRLTPAYLVMVGLYATWLPKLDSGPLWSRMIDEKERCRASWWTNILYINNYINTDQICMFQSWYLSVDTQLFIIAPAIIYPVWRWRKAGEFILSCITAITVVIPFTVTLVNRLDPTLMIYIREISDVSLNEYFKKAYIKTHMRASAYCFGLIFGYIVYRIQTNGYIISRLAVKIYWIIATISLIISMYSITIFYNIRQDFTILEAAIYSELHRDLWSLGTGWVVVACITDNSGPLRNFFKWKPFVPLSRLTYSAYLVNGIIELHSISITRTPQYLSVVSLFAKVMSHLIMTFSGAVILSTMFEGPILGLEKIFLRPAMESSKLSEKKSRHSTAVA